VDECSKKPYPDQASARVALDHIRLKPSTNRPLRVYPCDICDGWHLTSKRVAGKTPPWDRDPNWVRPTPRG